MVGSLQSIPPPVLTYCMPGASGTFLDLLRRRTKSGSISLIVINLMMLESREMISFGEISILMSSGIKRLCMRGLKASSNPEDEDWIEYMDVGEGY